MKKERGIIIPFDLIMELIFLFIIFLTPTIFDRRIGIVFSGTKVAWLRVFMVVALSFWALKLIVTREHRFFRTVLDWPIAAFLLTTTVATLTSVHVYTSFTGFYGRFEGLTTWYIFGLLFFLTTNFIRSREQIERVIITVLSAATLMSVYAFIQRQELDPYMWGGVVTWQRVIGTIGQPNFLAAYILMAFFLGLTIFLEKKNYQQAIDPAAQLFPLLAFLCGQGLFVLMIYTLEAFNIALWYLGFGLIAAAVIFFSFSYKKLHPLVLDLLVGGCLVLIYICLLYTQSRGGYMGFFTGATLFVLAAGRGVIFKKWKQLLLLGLVIVAVSAFTMLRPEYSPFERFTSEVSQGSENESQLELKGAAGSRGETWKSAFKIVADYPFFGVGPEVLKMVFPRYETELFRFKETFHVKQDRCHNETFDVPVTKGLISFFLYLWILGLFFLTGWQKRKTGPEAEKLIIAGLLAAALAYLIQNQFSFGVVAITSLFWVLWGLVMVCGGETEEAKTTKLSLGEIPVIPVVILALAALAFSYISFISFISDLHFKSGKTLLEMRRLPEAASEFKKALEIMPFEGGTISHLGITNLNLGNPTEAVNYLRYGTEVDPYNADNFYMLARVYLSYFDRGNAAALNQAKRLVEIALKIDPYYAEAYDTLGQINEREGKPDAALALYEKAFTVNPTLPDTMQRMISAGQKLGQNGRVRLLLAAAAKKFPGNLEIFKALEQLP